MYLRWSRLVALWSRFAPKELHSNICRHSKRLDSLPLSLVFRNTIARKAQRGKERTDPRAAVRDARGFPQAHSVCLSTKEDEERRGGGGQHPDDFESAKESKSNSSKRATKPRGRARTKSATRTESLRPVRVSENRRAERAPVSRRANRKRAFTTDVLLYLRGGL